MKQQIYIKVKQCKKHGWQKWHPNEECLICQYEEWHKEVYSIRPDWTTEDFEKWLDKGHMFGDLPRHRLSQPNKQDVRIK